MRSTKIVEAYGKLLLATAKAKKEAPNFNSSLVRLESMLRLIWPLIDEKQELKKLTDVFRDGKILVDKCITIRSWHIINCYTHSKKLKKLHDSLSYIFGINPDPIGPEAIRAMDRIIAILAKKKEDGRSDAISVEEIAHTPPTIFMETLVVVDKQEDGLSDAISAPLQQCRHFTFAEIQSATQNFDNALVIGKGGFGKVYRGFIDSGATIVAIKRLDPMSNQGDNEFRTEVEMLSKFRHCNLVSLIGYCYDGREMILVYEYMVNGSMADVLHPKDGRRNGNSSHLSWVQRLKICIGAARGIEYLHTGTGVLQRVIHRDVKSSNILLDENWAAKVSDFGLCKLGPANQSCTHVSTCVKGTPGYCDPDYFLTHRVTRKSDVFSFGVVLFEVLSGKPALDLRLPKERRSLMAWAQHCIQQNTPHKLIDPNLKWEIRSNSLEAFVGIAAQSLQNESKKRPTMAEVVLSLESALAIQTSKDFSLLNEDIFDFGETYDIDDCSLQSQGGSADNNYNESSELDENKRGIKTETEMNNDDGTSTSTKDINGDRWCINCGKVEACMLLFPCRHLCICSACNSLLHACPICNSTKTSSVHINMSS